MPRRKKKKKVDGPDIPPLQFVESPLNHSPNIPSPDFGPLNPMTARTVAVEDILDLSWVTPQFGNNPYCSRRRTTQSSRRTTRLHQKSEKYDQNLDDVTSKYKPLSFVGNNKSLQNKDKMVSRDKRARNIFDHGDLNIENQHVVSNVELCGIAEEPSPHSFRISTPNLERDELCCGSMASSVVLSPQRHKNNNEEFFTDNQESCPNERSQQNMKSCDLSQSSVLSVVFGKPVRPSSLFDCSSSPPPLPLPSVLVTDTPECEYDLTLRQRQLKYLLRGREKR